MTEPAAASVAYPLYQCHKQVRAVKILAINPDPTALYTGQILMLDEGFSPLPVPQHWIDKHTPVAGGYFVVYDDGYRSFSPAEPFEDGYVRIG
jgi:hypothetical protein